MIRGRGQSQTGTGNKGSGNKNKKADLRITAEACQDYTNKSVL